MIPLYHRKQGLFAVHFRWLRHNFLFPSTLALLKALAQILFILKALTKIFFFLLLFHSLPPKNQAVLIHTGIFWSKQSITFQHSFIQWDSPIYYLWKAWRGDSAYSMLSSFISTYDKQFVKLMQLMICSIWDKSYSPSIASFHFQILLFSYLHMNFILIFGFHP